MNQARLFAAYLSMSTAGATLIGGSFFLHETVAGAAPRVASKSVRRTASAPPSAKAANEAAPSGATSLRTRARRGDDAPSGGRASDSPKEGTQGAQGKTTTDPSAATKSATSDNARSDNARLPDGTASAPNPATTSSRPADARPSAAKAPADAPSIVKSTAEKFAAEPTSDVADSSRPSTDVTAPGARRDVASAAVAAARAIAVTLEGPVFDGGDVPRAAAALDRMKASFVRCASTETALTKNEGSIDVRFLVRAPGRAEGVDVDKVRGVSGDVVRCMTSVLARSYVGAPSDDPVGVAFTVRVKRPEAANN